MTQLQSSISTAQQITASLGPYTTPEQCFKKAEELYKLEGKWYEALIVLHVGIQNRKTKQNMIILEKLMNLMIDICSEKLTTLYLKDDIGYFRNLCQHQSMNLLEKVLTYLRNKCDKVYDKLEKDYSQEQLMKFISDEEILGELEPDQMNEQDATSDELLLMAYSSMDYLEEKNQILPRANFYLETCKNILDTLRSNSKLLEFYNDTARKIFSFCEKYKNKKEYRRISETLHSHFNQIIKYDKSVADQSSKIPYPIKLDEELQVTQVLKLRKEQLELALKMEEWTDAHKISNNIYQLMRKFSKKKSQQQINEIYSEFFEHLAQIFWKSHLYLFHSYALQNVQYLVKTLKNKSSLQRQEINDKFVLAALSIPLNNKLTNFERLSFNYVPSSMKQYDETNLMAREELLETAQMLRVDGLPSRASIIDYINIESINTSTTNHVANIFNLIEHEESPFVISKKGKEALEALCKENPSLAIYRPFIIKTLSVRILQKCKNFYKNIKLSKLQQMLTFYKNQNEIEILLFECNRQNLLYTTLSYDQNGQDGVLIFNQEASVVENLFEFGNQLQQVFHQVVEETTQGKSQRLRIFQKVKEKLDEEALEMQQQREEMLLIQKQLAEQRLKEKMDIEKAKIAEEERKKREMEQQKIRDDQRRQRNELLDTLERQKKIKALEILNILSIKGFKKVNKEKIKDLQNNPEKISYDSVIEFYQQVLRKEREQIEEDKKKKMREVELWNRALREEEKLAIEKYAQENGDKAMAQLQEQIKEKQQKELKDKQALETARPAYKAFIDKQLKIRHELWANKKKEFINKKMNILKDIILEAAKAELFKEENRIILARKAAERKARDDAIKQKEKEKGTFDSEPSGDSWSKGVAKPQEPVQIQEQSSPKKFTRGEKQEDFAITRSEIQRNPKKEEEKKVERAPEKKEDNVFSRSSKVVKKDEGADSGFDRKFGQSDLKKSNTDSQPKKSDNFGFTRGLQKSQTNQDAASSTKGPEKKSETKDSGSFGLNFRSNAPKAAKK